MLVEMRGVLGGVRGRYERGVGEWERREGVARAWLGRLEGVEGETKGEAKGETKGDDKVEGVERQMEEAEGVEGERTGLYPGDGKVEGV